jgi:predicted transcriptional regulator
MGELITMSNQELRRAELMQRLIDKRLKQADAAALLNLTRRQIKRLLRAYRNGGPAALISKRRGKPGNHRLAHNVMDQALHLIHSQYADFGPTLAHEKLTEVHQLKLSVEAVRQLMIAADLWKPRRGKAPRIHQSRADNLFQQVVIFCDLLKLIPEFK